MKKWYYLSFADQDKPEGEKWSGCCCVEAEDHIDAVREARRQGCNPGGEVLMQPVPDSEVVPEAIRNKLITDLKFLELIFGKVTKVSTHGMECECCKKELE